MALSTMGHIRKELASLYREARTGGIDISDATKLGYLLQILAKVIEQSEFEERVERLEREFENEKFNKTYKGYLADHSLSYRA
jgi:hypothetical protein